MDKITFHVNAENHGSTLSQFLKGRKVSYTFVRRLKKNRQIHVNGAPAYPQTELSEGDVVELFLPSEHISAIEPEAVPFAVLYDDEDLLIVDKPAGIAVHPTLNHPSGTLANGVLHHWLAKGERRMVRLVNRLDKDTSGIVVIAKHPFAQHHLSSQQNSGEFHKEYLALVHGHVQEAEGEIRAPIGRKDGSIIEREVRLDGQEAVTCYSVIRKYSNYTLVRIRLLTGRTHQIRVHFAYMGHPLLGDDLYGGSRERIARQALHAGLVRMIHPRTNQVLEIEAPLPEDFKPLL